MQTAQTLLLDLVRRSGCTPDEAGLIMDLLVYDPQVQSPLTLYHDETSQTTNKLTITVSAVGVVTYNVVGTGGLGVVGHVFDQYVTVIGGLGSQRAGTWNGTSIGGNQLALTYDLAGTQYLAVAVTSVGRTVYQAVGSAPDHVFANQVFLGDGSAVGGANAAMLTFSGDRTGINKDIIAAAPTLDGLGNPLVLYAAPTYNASANGQTLGGITYAPTISKGTYTIPTHHGIWLINPITSGAGTITTAYGLRVDAITVGATNYSIYSGGNITVAGGGINVTGNSTFSDNVGIGTSPTSQIGLTLSPTITGAGGSGYGMQLNGSITAGHNFDSAVGLSLSFVANSSTFTGLDAIGIDVGFNTNVSGGGSYDHTYGLRIDAMPTGVVATYAIYTSNGKVRFGDELLLSASTTARPSLNLPSGTAPTSPADGDFWYDGTNLKFRHGGTTQTVTWT